MIDAMSCSNASRPVVRPQRRSGVVEVALRGVRCVLRSVRRAELGELHRLVNQGAPAGAKLALPPRSELSFRREFDETAFLGPTLGRLVVAGLDGRLLGTVVYSRDGDAFEIGYQLFDPDAGNKGLMSEAVRMAVDYLFAQHDIHRLQVVIAPANEPSKRLAQKCGFRFEGKLRGRVFLHDAQHDPLLYSLIRHDS